MSRKVSRKGLTKKADRLFSLKVRARGYCELAGKDEVPCRANLQCAHIIGRRYRSTRWADDNALSLCQGHHVYYTHRPEGWFLLIESLFPGRWEALYRRAQEQWDGDLERILDGLGAGIPKGRNPGATPNPPETRTRKAGRASHE